MSNLPDELRARLAQEIAAAEHPREQIINVMYALQKHYGYFSDEAVHQAAALMHMTPLEIEEVGKYVIHVCDGVVCWMFNEMSVFDYLCRKLGVDAGAVTADGLFTVLPAACIGYCDHAPAMLINGVMYGPLTPEKIDAILEKLRAESVDLVVSR
jgi:NADH-quinone oxidoreductase subunit E